VLAELLKTRQDLLRFLLFLLGHDATERILDLDSGLHDPVTSGRDDDAAGAAPLTNLFEPMVRALAHDPTKLDEIDRLIRDLVRTDGGRELLPEDWETVWDPIWAARLARPST
jgi:hypothetical protein